MVTINDFGRKITFGSQDKKNLDGRLEVFAIGSDNNLHHIWQTSPNNGWLNWQSLGSKIIAAQIVVYNGEHEKG
jgi:hypothetical protein